MSDLMQQYEKDAEKRLEVNLKHAENGVKFIDIRSAYIDEDVSIGTGTVIYPGVVIEGESALGEDCFIGQNTRISNTKVGDRTKIEQSVLLDSEVGEDTNVGPFAYVRPNSKIGNNAKVGDFVEVKNSSLGNGSKASHLTYIGDADVGDNVNLGCGVVFVNYDGKNKHRSTIKDGSFIGCNVNIVSPVTVGESAYIAAGTTLTRDVPSGSLSVGRAKEKNIEGWVEKRGLLKGKDKKEVR